MSKSIWYTLRHAIGLGNPAKSAIVRSIPVDPPCPYTGNPKHEVHEGDCVTCYMAAPDAMIAHDERGGCHPECPANDERRKNLQGEENGS